MAWTCTSKKQRQRCLTTSGRPPRRTPLWFTTLKTRRHTQSAARYMTWASCVHASSKIQETTLHRWSNPFCAAERPFLLRTTLAQQAHPVTLFDTPWQAFYAHTSPGSWTATLRQWSPHLRRHRARVCTSAQRFLPASPTPPGSTPPCRLAPRAPATATPQTPAQSFDSRIVSTLELQLPSRQLGRPGSTPSCPACASHCKAPKHLLRVSLSFHVNTCLATSKIRCGSASH